MVVLSMSSRLPVAFKVVLAGAVALLAYVGPAMVLMAATTPLHSSDTAPCVAGEQLSTTKECLGNLDAAKKRWPGAQLALDTSSLPPSGTWLVIAADGRHFNQLSITNDISPLSHSVLRPTNAASRSGPWLTMPGIATVSAGTITSGSGKWSGTCHSQYAYSYRIHYSTWYGANLDLKSSGILQFCDWVSISELPIVWGAGVWTNTNGTYFNGSQHSYVYWTGQIWLCCTDTYQEYFSVGMFGNYYWSVQE
jgi:hypothetical protein